MRQSYFHVTSGLLAVLLSILIAVTPASASDVSPGDLLARPDRFHGKAVALSSRVTNLRETVSRRGNAYYTYDLHDGRVSIRIFSFGKAPCPEGSDAVVEGVYSKEKPVSGRTFYNEVEAITTRCS